MVVLSSPLQISWVDKVSQMELGSARQTRHLRDGVECHSLSPPCPSSNQQWAVPMETAGAR